MNPVGWFELPATDIERAENFYKAFFGFEFARQEEKDGYIMSWFPMTMESYGAAGTLIKGELYVPSDNGVTVYFSVPSVADAMTKAEEMGVTVLMPKTDIGEHGFFAWILDSEGNRIAVHSMEG